MKIIVSNIVNTDDRIYFAFTVKHKDHIKVIKTDLSFEDSLKLSSKDILRTAWTNVKHDVYQWLHVLDKQELMKNLVEHIDTEFFDGPENGIICIR